MAEAEREVEREPRRAEPEDCLEGCLKLREIFEIDMEHRKRVNFGAEARRVCHALGSQERASLMEPSLWYTGINPSPRPPHFIFASYVRVKI